MRISTELDEKDATWLAAALTSKLADLQEKALGDSAFEHGVNRLISTALSLGFTLDDQKVSVPVQDENRIAVKVAEEVIDELNIPPQSYSGRFMYGKTCLGFTCKSSQQEELLEIALRHGLRGFRTDSMGRDIIVYWPDTPWSEELQDLAEDGD